MFQVGLGVGNCAATHLRVSSHGFAARFQARFSSSTKKGWLADHTDKLKLVLKEYGKIAVVFHASVWVATFGASYTCVRMGLDVRHFKIPLINLEDIDPDASSLFLAYLVTTATGPLRGGATIVMSPWIARMLRKRP
ncbi:hypothetical protein LEN26_019524 [Aphanomyces euteiches]|nr:hypothetical protein LEN26_019524 [Aphanomyces euteiches]KAH9126981.1 hypothetical protein AeMF1_002657 [Aphanomyces euteiches]KAH9192403.1 hypothetical protein AeNC1_005614 [Aphanomyces euteiches]